MGGPRAQFGIMPWLVFWRASRTGDPVERLRYLRAAAQGIPAESLDSLPTVPRVSRSGRVGMAAGIIVLLLATVSRITSHGVPRPAPTRPLIAAQAAGPASAVWLVERSDGFDVYSNGLRIDGKYTVAHRQRRYRALDRRSGEPPALVERIEPAGIVYHTTESHQAPFEEDYSGELRHAGMSLLEYVRYIRAYHFVIDRFGRVFRVVQETDMADHAGHSVWADERWIYVGLNASFLGVAFEAHTPDVTPAQVHSARMLTEMLRSKYRLAASNCVTHAQVSVNPANLRMGYHTDWAVGFPYAQIGLPDNYRAVPASLALYGFAYDGYLIRAAGGQPWSGLIDGDDDLSRRAAIAAMPLALYRATLQRRYREAVAAIGNAPVSPLAR
jgi:hypothetical protein